MIPELGFIALLFAMLIAGVQTVAGIAASLAPAPQAELLASIAAGAVRSQFVAIAVAFAALMYAHATSDFTVLNVVSNSNSQLPLLYKCAGTWGSHEGSMLLWVLVLAIFGLLLPNPARAHSGDEQRLRLGARGMQGMIGFAFLAFIVLTSNPFIRVLPAAPDGQDLNPILQDPALAFHPPLLYLGYVGFSSVFALAASGLLTGVLDRRWAAAVRPYALAAWGCLTLGIALGSDWAYTELGWGGWWFWDPVENAALMPWLAGTALIHALIVMERRGALANWTAFLALLAFVLSLIGTFLVRSGVITSVHAFANDPSRGLFILLLLTCLAGGGFALFAWRAREKSDADFALISRESAFVLNNLFFSAIAATVVIGTLYPYALQLTTGRMISVGAPYFNRTVIPLALPLLVLMAIAPRLDWRRANLATLQPLARSTILPAMATLAALAIWQHGWPLMAWPFTILAVGIACGALPEGKVGWHYILRTPRRLGMIVAHIGFALALLGMAGDACGKSEQTVALGIGESAELAGYKLTLDKLRAADGPNYRAIEAWFKVASGDGGEAFTLVSERRFYPTAGQDVTQAAIRTTGLADLYVAMGDPVRALTPDGQTTRTQRIGFRLSYHPLVPLLWGGSLLMVLGALLAGSGFLGRLAQKRSMLRQPLNLQA